MCPLQLLPFRQFTSSTTPLFLLLFHLILSFWRPLFPFSTSSFTSEIFQERLAAGNHCELPLPTDLSWLHSCYKSLTHTLILSLHWSACLCLEYVSISLVFYLFFPLLIYFSLSICDGSNVGVSGGKGRGWLWCL